MDIKQLTGFADALSKRAAYVAVLFGGLMLRWGPMPAAQAQRECRQVRRLGATASVVVDCGIGVEIDMMALVAEARAIDLGRDGMAAWRAGIIAAADELVEVLLPEDWGCPPRGDDGSCPLGEACRCALVDRLTNALTGLAP